MFINKTLWFVNRSITLTINYRHLSQRNLIVCHNTTTILIQTQHLISPPLQLNSQQPVDPGRNMPTFRGSLRNQPPIINPSNVAAIISVSDDSRRARSKLANAAVAVITEGQPTKDELNAALGKIWDWEWAWKATRISESSFLLKFPSMQKLKAVCSTEATFLTMVLRDRFRDSTKITCRLGHHLRRAFRLHKLRHNERHSLGLCYDAQAIFIYNLWQRPHNGSSSSGILCPQPTGHLGLGPGFQRSPTTPTCRVVNRAKQAKFCPV